MIKVVVYVISILLTIFLAIIYNSSSMVFLAGVELFFFLFLMVILFISARCMKISFQTYKVYVESGEKANVILNIENKSIFPIRQIRTALLLENLTTGVKSRQEMKTGVGIKEKKQIEWSTELSYGIWRVSCSKVRIYDLLIWFTLQKRKNLQMELIQMPQKHEVNLRKIMSDSELSMEQEEYEKNGSDTSHIREIREYRAGDSIRSIHWKLSAKKDQLMVKEYGQSAGYDLLFGLDIRELKIEGLEIIYSLICRLIEQKCKVFMVWQGIQENRLVQYTLHNEDDIYMAIECIMRNGLSSWNQELPETSGKCLLLKEQRLLLDEVLIEDFSNGDRKKKLLEMELIL